MLSARRELALWTVHSHVFSTQTHVASNEQLWLSTQEKMQGQHTIESVAHTVTILLTKGSWRPLWTRGLGESDLEKELFELNL